MNLYFLISLVVIVSLCWGSFLAATAYRIACDKPLMRPRSHCTHCDHLIAWYDNIPVISWIILRGACRHCKQSISPYYPFIELSTMVTMTSLFLKIFKPYFYTAQSLFLCIHPLLSFLAYSLFFSALIISTATDLIAMVIPQCATLWLIPMGTAAAYFNIISISPLDSVIGTVAGYGALWFTAKLFTWFTKKEGLGIGDMELLAMIGSFTGPIGIWIGLMLGSLSGMILGGGYLVVTKKGHSARIPFGPFLALGAVLYFFFGPIFIRILGAL